MFTEACSRADRNSDQPGLVPNPERAAGFGASVDEEGEGVWVSARGRIYIKPNYSSSLQRDESQSPDDRWS